MIVRLEAQLLEGDLRESIFNFLTIIAKNDNCRGGALLIINGLLNTLPKDNVM